MDSFECDLAANLLPIFIEGKCSVETNDFVKNHIKECEECSKIYETMTAEIMPKTYTNIKKSFRLHPAIKMAFVVLAYLVSLIVLLTIITFIFVDGII